MLILVPPSEGKATPRPSRRSAAPLDLGRLSFPSLEAGRAEVLSALVELCSSDPATAAGVLGLGPTQAEAVAANARLESAPTTRADRVYTGVLYEALDLPGLEPSAKRRAGRWLAITSGLFGLLRTGDPIPAYRLSGSVTLPGLGPVARHWNRHLGSVLDEAAATDLVVDLRSSGYVPFWRPPRAVAERVVTVRVLHEVDGRRTVVSHFNKATKGRLVRSLLVDGSAPRRPAALVEQLRDLGWYVEVDGNRLDVVVAAL